MRPMSALTAFNEQMAERLGVELPSNAEINRQQQGDLREASAIEWLTSVGATILSPFGHSPDVDLVACAHGGS